MTVISLQDETVWDGFDLVAHVDETEHYGRHAQRRHEEQISVWELYGVGDYQGKHRDDDWIMRPAVVYDGGQFVRFETANDYIGMVIE